MEIYKPHLTYVSKKLGFVLDGKVICDYRWFDDLTELESNNFEHMPAIKTNYLETKFEHPNFKTMYLKLSDQGSC